jgi:hypothetical protein
MSFRGHTYVFVADIKQMYPQVLVGKTAKYQNILWVYDTSHKIAIYRLKTLTFGTAQVPYLATRSLFHISQGTNNDKVRNILSQDFYAHDVLYGSDNKKDLMTTMADLIDELKKYGMTLTKFSSNNGYQQEEVTRHLKNYYSTKNLLQKLLPSRLF